MIELPALKSGNIRGSRRQRIFFAFVFFGMLAAGLVGGAVYAMAEVGVFHPGGLLFPVQDFVEQTWARRMQDPAARAEYFLRLAERRAGDLEWAAGTNSELMALRSLDQALDHALDQAALAVADSPQTDTDTLRARLEAFVQLTEELLRRLSRVPVEDPDGWRAFVAKVSALHQLIDGPNFHPLALSGGNYPAPSPTLAPPPGSSPAGTPHALLPSPQVVFFPPGSGGAQHSFFPLTGRHGEIDCQACHPAGRYTGALPECRACHRADIPPSHYPGKCSLCHVSSGWLPAVFDHAAAGAMNCVSCHANQLPANHYTGQCSACHSSRGWKPASFNHLAAGATNCSACHLEKKPANHYSGQCSLCHSTNAWKPAVFNHQAAGAAECTTCHLSKKPANHYNGQCSACHTTAAWKPAEFDHQAAGAADCSNCHLSRKPTNHYNGQCSACHSTAAWLPASFNHEVAGATDCTACHLSRKPTNHYSGQCSACHSTTAWRPASFNHQAAGATDCTACHLSQKPANHYSGQCSACHTTAAWRPATFDHQANGATDCQACHLGKRPANHFDGQCSACHSTRAWTPATFTHTFPTNHQNANGVCSKCHPSGSSAWTCYNCHNQNETEKHHAEKDIFNISSRCLECHPTGRKE